MTHRLFNKLLTVAMLILVAVTLILISSRCVWRDDSTQGVSATLTKSSEYFDIQLTAMAKEATPAPVVEP